MDERTNVMVIVAYRSACCHVVAYASTFAATQPRSLPHCHRRGGQISNAAEPYDGHV